MEKKPLMLADVREGRCSRIVLYFPQGGGVITGTNHRGIARYLESTRSRFYERVRLRVLHLCFLERLLFLLLLPSRETFRFREIIADGRGNGFLYRSLYDEEGSLAMEEVPVLRSRYPFVLSCKFSSRAWKRKSA